MEKTPLNRLCVCIYIYNLQESCMANVLAFVLHVSSHVLPLCSAMRSRPPPFRIFACILRLAMNQSY